MKNDMIRLARVVIINPFDGATKSAAREIDVHGCRTVYDAVEMAFPSIGVSCFSIDGRIVQKDDPLPPCDFCRLVAWRMPEGIGSGILLTALLVKALFVAAVCVAVTTLYNFIAKKSNSSGHAYGKETEDVSDTQYGWDYNAENAITEGSPVPVIYGTRYVIPPIIQQHIYVEGGSKMIEVVYAAAQGGGGFNDIVGYEADDNGYVKAQLGHASWRNYISRSVVSDANSYSINRASGATCYIDYDTSDGTYSGTTSLVTDGTLQASTSGIARPDDNVTIDLGQQCKGMKIELYSESRQVYSNSTKTWRKGIVGFSAYGKNSLNQWVLIGTTTQHASYNSSYIKAVLDDSSSDEIYTMVKLCSFVSDGAHGYEISTEGAIVEVKIYSRTYAGASVESERISFGLTSGLIDDSFPSFITAGVWGALEVSKNIDVNEFTFRTTPGAYPDKIAINLTFPYGLYTINDSTGDFDTKTVRIIAKFKPHDSDTWTMFDGFASTGKGVSGSKTDEKYLYYEQDVTDYGAESYDVCVKYYMAYTNDSNNQSTLTWDTLEEGWNDTVKYVKTAVACLKVKASEMLYGSVPQLKILLSRKYVNVYDTVSEEWCYADASNPAWAAYDLIVRPQFDDTNAVASMSDSTLAREAYSHNNMVFSDFVKWARFCNKKGISMSMYYDGTTTVKDALKYIVEIGRAAIVLRGNMIGVLIDGEASSLDSDGYPTGCFCFDDTNIVAKSWKMSYNDVSESPSRVNITYYDKERDWNRFTVIATSDDYENSELEQDTSDVTLYTCDDMTVAEKHAAYLLREKLIRRTFSWKGDLDSMALDVGDNVKLYDDYVTIVSISVDEDGYREFTGVEYVPERFPSSENVSGTVGDGLYYLS